MLKPAALPPDPVLDISSDMVKKLVEANRELVKLDTASLQLSYNTVSSAVNKLVELGILRETTNASRNRVFAYEEYLKILRKDT